MITFKWNITQLDCFTQVDGQNNVVFCVHYTFNGTDGTHDGLVIGTVMLTIDLNSGYIPFDQLTEDIVIGWVQGELGNDEVGKYVADITNQINTQVPPTVTVPILPWNQ